MPLIHCFLWLVLRFGVNITSMVLSRLPLLYRFSYEAGY